MSLDAVLYMKERYRAADPLGSPQVQCLDVYAKVKQSRLQRVRSKISGSLRPLVPLGSMLDEKLMRADSKWLSADAATLVDELRAGLEDLRDATVEGFREKIFVKEKFLKKLKVDFTKGRGSVLWLSGVAGIDLGKDAMLSATLTGLTTASVDYLTICQWVRNGDWRPDVPFLNAISSDYAKDQKNKIKSLWIVSEVLYAEKLTITVGNGHLYKVMASAQAISGVPAILDAKAEVGVRKVDESTLELKAYEEKQFVVGYRTVRVDYYPNETKLEIRSPHDGGLRADDDDPYQTSLQMMEEDIFERDEDGEEFPIPLLALTEEELDELIKSPATDRPSTNPDDSAAEAHSGHQTAEELMITDSTKYEEL